MKKLLALFLMAGLVPACTFAEVTAPAGGEPVQTLTGDSAAEVPSVAAVNRGMIHPLDKLMILGDSNSATNTGVSYGFPGETWTEVLKQKIPTLNILNLAVAGHSASNQLPLFNASSSYITTTQNCAVAMMFAWNDIAAIGYAAAYTNYIELSEAVRSAGCSNQVFISYYGASSVNTNNFVLLNSLVKGYALSNGYSWVDGADTLNKVGTAYVNTNYIYASTNAHLGVAGHKILANLVMESVFNGTPPLAGKFTKEKADLLYVPSTFSRTVELSGYRYIGSTADIASPPGAGSIPYRCYRHKGVNSYHILDVPYGATNLTVGMQFGPEADTTNSVKTTVTLSALNDAGTGSKAVVIFNEPILSSTNGYTGTGTNAVFQINMEIPPDYWFSTNVQVYLLTTTSTNPTTCYTNFFWNHTAQLYQGL